MLTFYPGPSKVYPQIAQYLQDAYSSGILSVNHRSQAFMDICKKTLELLHQKLNIPSDYSITFVSSATESWEIIAQSFTKNAGLHLYNGAFGEKWFEYADKLKPESWAYEFEPEEYILPSEITFHHETELICLTQNETSNGTQVKPEYITQFKAKFPEPLLAVDATSSLGGIALPFEEADLWFASVQKCLGLPAGLGLLITSPKALEKAKTLNDNLFYNSFLFMHRNIRQFQTHYTPNVLNIYLLMRVMERVETIDLLSEKTKQRATDLYSFFENNTAFQPPVNNPDLRSDTVLCLKGEEKEIASIKEKAKTSGITLGNGYGAWKNTTFRIANFPQITDNEFVKLKEFFTT
jgi:phosphoserine aminotransferase